MRRLGLAAKALGIAAGLVPLMAGRLAWGQQADLVHFDIDAQQDAKPISRFIYGINQFHSVLDGMEGPWSHATFTRLWGNRSTAYNWTNNASNAGSDYHFQSDDYLVNGPEFSGVADLPGGAVTPVIKTAYAHNAAVLLTIPINGYVAADKTPGDVRQSADFLHTRFRPEMPRKNGPFTLTPDPNSPVVYQDEFVNWVNTTFPYGQTDANRPIWFGMDNEPDYWFVKHAEIHPDHTTYAELVEKTIAYASAVKDVIPGAVIFGSVNYGWHGYETLQDAPDQNGRDFQVFFLQQMAAAEKSAGKRLMDVLDVHYYPEAQSEDGIRIEGGSETSTPSVVAARLQAPRSLWDPTYVEKSWITKDATHGKAIQLIPRLRGKIDQNYPGTKLSVTEYDFGGIDDISGGIAEADVLGIFGREGVFAAAYWPPYRPGKPQPYISGAIEMFRDFDGKGGAFGDTSISAWTDDVADSSVYASTDSGHPRQMMIVAINKTGRALRTLIRVQHCAAFTRGQVYQLTSGGPDPRPAGELNPADAGGIRYVMPAYSVSTIRLSDGSGAG